MTSAKDRFAELEQFPGRPTEEVESTVKNQNIFDIFVEKSNIYDVIFYCLLIAIDLGDDEIDGFFKQIDDIRENINTISQKVEDTKKKYAGGW